MSPDSQDGQQRDSRRVDAEGDLHAPTESESSRCHPEVEECGYEERQRQTPLALVRDGSPG